MGAAALPLVAFAVLAAVPAPSQNARGALVQADDDAQLQLQMPPPHPRLLATASDIARVRTLIKHDPLGKLLYARLLVKASPAGVAARAAAGDGRTDARRVVDCALLYRITGNASWAAAGIAEVTSQANAKTT